MFRVRKTVSCNLGSRSPISIKDYYRRCLGVNFADASLFLWCAIILAVYDISKAKGPGGKTLEPTCEYMPKTIMCVFSWICGYIMINADDYLFVVLLVTYSHSIIQSRRDRMGLKG